MLNPLILSFLPSLPLSPSRTFTSISMVDLRRVRAWSRFCEEAEGEGEGEGQGEGAIKGRKEEEEGNEEDRINSVVEILVVFCQVPGAMVVN